jgi:sugar phosphate isomerase/epimerase
MSVERSLPIALQMYSVRNVPLSLDEVLGKVAEMGYRAVETLHTHNLSAGELRGLLDKHNLIAMVSLQAMEADPEGVIAFHKALGSDTITVPAIPQDQRPTSGQGFVELGARLGKLGRLCAAEGVRLFYHNHAWEMEQVDGKLIIDWILEGDEPRYLNFQPDLTWVLRGGVDPVELVNRYAGRCALIHCKDVTPDDPNAEEIPATPEWTPVLKACEAQGAEWYIVEHDKPIDPLAAARLSLEKLAGLLAPLR